MVGKEVWSCHHHSIASIAGYRLQMQMVTPKHRAGFRQEREVVEAKNRVEGIEVIDEKEPDEKHDAMPKISRTRRNVGASTSRDTK